jgi:glyoxylase-like metal-dependent hydrolase (beta-lactamase superfamily II)
MSGTGALSYEVLVSGMAPVRGGKLSNGEHAPVVAAHTFIYGPKTVLLVDPPITASRTAAFGDWIAGHDSVRGFIYLTHWHGDHWLGTAPAAPAVPGGEGPGSGDRPAGARGSHTCGQEAVSGDSRHSRRCGVSRGITAAGLPRQGVRRGRVWVDPRS